jgi:hypothetical protein
MQNFQLNSKSSVEQVDLYKFQKLYSGVLSKLRIDIANLKNGDLNELVAFPAAQYSADLDAASFNAAAYNTAEITSLQGYVRNPFTFLEYRNIFADVVSGIDVVNNLNTSYKSLQSKIDTLNTELDTFRSIKSQVVTSLNLNIYADARVNITETELLPWYSEYLYLYGPPNGAFDQEKLSYIVDRQIQAGLYTLEYYLSTPKFIIN